MTSERDARSDAGGDDHERAGVRATGLDSILAAEGVATRCELWAIPSLVTDRLIGDALAGRPISPPDLDVIVHTDCQQTEAP